MAPYRPDAEARTRRVRSQPASALGPPRGIPHTSSKRGPAVHVPRHKAFIVTKHQRPRRTTLPISELRLFQSIWHGGYYEGDPLDPLAPSRYGDLGYISVLHAIYQACIKPFVRPHTAVVEIGPGRGAWTKTMLQAREIWCLDALSAEHNGFWEYIGKEHENRVRYFQVKDFSCSDLPDNHFDFLFSFGAFCHITWEGQQEYLRSLLPKLRDGGVGMVMVADFDKYNSAIQNSRNLRARRVHGNPVLSSILDALRYARRSLEEPHEPLLLDQHDGSLAAGKWYHAGIEETCQLLESIGWKVVNPDVGMSHRDPIVHFIKPAR